MSGSTLSISGKELQNLSITNTTQLEKVFPGLQLKNMTGSHQPMGTVRGLSSRVSKSQTLSLYVDGIPQDFGFLAQELIDVKNIEFLRGPQGTLYGVGGYAGLINITTHAIDSPILRIKGNTDISYLRENAVFSLSSPVINNWLYVGGNFSYTKENGMLIDITRKQRIDTSDTWSGNATFAFVPKDLGFKALFKYSKHILNDSHYLHSVTDKMFEDKKLNTQLPKLPPYSNNNLCVYSLHLSQQLDKTNLANTLSYQDYKYDWNLPSNLPSPLPPYIGTSGKRKTITEELSLSTSYDNGSYSTFGLYYQNIHSKINPKDNAQELYNHLFAVYGNASITLGESFDMSLGLRYTLNKSLLEIPGKGTAFAIKNDLVEHLISPRASLGYKINEDNRFYLMYSSGHLPGGFFESAYAIGDKNPFKAEKSQNLELGISSSLWDNKIRLNANIYGMYISNKQYIQFNEIGKISKITNLGTAYSAGLETNIKAAFISSVLLSFGGSFGHAAYIKALDPITKENLKKKTLLFAPDISANLNIDWNFLKISKAKFFFNLNTNFYSKIHFEYNEDASQKPYFLLDGSVRMEYAKFVVNLQIANAFNQFYNRYIYSKNKHYIGDIRNIGLSIKYEL